MTLKTVPTEHEGKKIQGYISVVQRLTDFWKVSQIWSPILRIFFQCKHPNAKEASLVEILGPAQREVNPRESWGIRSLPLKGEETQGREKEGEIFPLYETNLRIY